MKRIVAVSAVALTAVLLIGAAGLAGWQAYDRVGMIQTLCKAGLPNLSRPREIDARALDCAVLGKKQRLRGFISTSFENATLTVGEHIELTPQGFYKNASAWYSGTTGLSERGDGSLGREIEKLHPGLCGLRVAKVEVEGWMTISPGQYGHLGLADREFYIYRVISATTPDKEDLEAFRLPEFFFAQDPTYAAHCAAIERGEDPFLPTLGEPPALADPPPGA